MTSSTIKLFSIETLENIVGGKCAPAYPKEMAKQLADTMRENERLREALDKAKMSASIISDSLDKQQSPVAHTLRGWSNDIQRTCIDALALCKHSVVDKSDE